MVQHYREINELYVIKHFNEEVRKEEEILPNNLSPVLYRNNTVTEFLGICEKMVKLMFSSVLVARNFFTYSVDKDYDGYDN